MTLLNPLTTEAASCGVVLLNALCIAEAACTLTSSCDACPGLFRSSGREEKYLRRVEDTREEATKVATTRSDLMDRSNKGERETQLVQQREERILFAAVQVCEHHVQASGRRRPQCRLCKKSGRKMCCTALLAWELELDHAETQMGLSVQVTSPPQRSGRATPVPRCRAACPVYRVLCLFRKRYRRRSS